MERFCYKGFLRNSSGTKCFVRLREVSALEDVRFREVPLYILFLAKMKGIRESLFGGCNEGRGHSLRLPPRALGFYKRLGCYNFPFVKFEINPSLFVYSLEPLTARYGEL